MTLPIKTNELVAHLRAIIAVDNPAENYLDYDIVLTLLDRLERYEKALTAYVEAEDAYEGEAEDDARCRAALALARTALTGGPE